MFVLYNAIMAPCGYFMEDGESGKVKMLKLSLSKS